MNEPGRWFFYVIECDDRSYYAGVTTNVRRRYNDHLASTMTGKGKGGKFFRMKKHRPNLIVLVQECPLKSAAMRMEARFKRLTRVQKIAYVLGFGRQ